MLHDEIRQLLQELVGAVGADRIAILHPAGDEIGAGAGSGGPDVYGAAARIEAGPDGSARALLRFPLGRGVWLQIERPVPAPEASDLPARDTATEPGGTQPGMLDMEQRMIVERTVRAVRAAVRRWQADHAPALSVTAADEPAPPPHERVRERIQAFLQALANSHDAVNVLVTLQGDVVASSLPLAELHRERIPFTLRRVAAEASRQSGRSHAELAGEDFYAASFWFDACLIAFFSAPYAEDFFRYRARLVIRELSQLLPLLDEPPPTAAQEAPLPPE